MSNLLKVDIVSVDKPFWSGEAISVTVQTVEGEIGILYGHEPIMGQLGEDGLVVISDAESNSKYLAVCGGFFSMDGVEVIVLAEDATWVDDIDLAAEESKLSTFAPGSFEFFKTKGRIKTAKRAASR